MQRLRSLPWRPLLYYFLTGLVLVLPALYNTVPLVYSDTGTYLVSARTLLPPVDRTIGYGLLIRAVNWQATLWTVVFFQGMTASWLIHRTMITLLPRHGRDRRLHLVVLVVLLLVSSLPWYASQIMPDVLTGLLALCVFLLLYGRGLGRTGPGLLVVLTFFFAIAHVSHLLVLVALVVAVALVSHRRHWGPTRKTLALVGMIPVLGIASIMGYNAFHGQGAVLSRTSDLFLAGRFIESGAMHLHLKRTCDDTPVFLCPHRDSLVNNAAHFVWLEAGPLRQGADLVAANDRVRPVVRALLADPRNWPYLAWSGALGTAQQLVHVDVGSGIVAYREESAPWWVISEHYAHELPLYMTSFQQRGGWKFDRTNRVNYLTLALSVLAIAWWWPARRSVRWWNFLFIMVAFTVLNAACTGALANVYERLQARVTWLLVLAGVLLVVRWWSRSFTARRGSLRPLPVDHRRTPDGSPPDRT